MVQPHNTQDEVVIGPETLSNETSRRAFLGTLMAGAAAATTLAAAPASVFASTGKLKHVGAGIPTGDAAILNFALTLEHLEPFEPAVHEVARILEPGGLFCCFLNHPLLQSPGSGWIDDHILDEQYWRVGPYLPDDVAMEEVAPGIRLPFMHRPLSRYINVMADCGLLVERMEEPPPPPGFLAQAWEYAEAATIPRLLLLRARKHA